MASYIARRKILRDARRRGGVAAPDEGRAGNQAGRDQQTIDHIGSLPSDLGFVDGQNITIEYRHDSGVLSIRPLGSTNQYSLVSGLPASRACTHLAW
jgi:hypothetical protein